MNRKFVFLSMLLILAVFVIGCSKTTGQATFTGQLEVLSSPTGASVYVNNILKGTTPLTLNLDPAIYKVRLEKPDYQNYEQQATVTAGSKTTVSITLILAVNKLEVLSTPAGANVYIDGSLAGVTPLTKVVGIGTHNVKLTKQYYIDYSMVTEVKPKEQARIEKTLVLNGNGTLKITSNPSKALVVQSIWGNPQLGTTPLTKELKADYYNLKLLYTAYNESNVGVYVKPGEVTILDVVMEKV